MLLALVFSICTVRPEGALYAAMVGGAIVAIPSDGTGWMPSSPQRRGELLRVAAVAAAVVLTVLVLTAWRVVYYGSWLPNTFYAKVTGGSGQWQNGGRYLLDLFEGIQGYSCCCAVWGGDDGARASEKGCFRGGDTVPADRGGLAGLRLGSWRRWHAAGSLLPADSSTGSGRRGGGMGSVVVRRNREWSVNGHRSGRWEHPNARVRGGCGSGRGECGCWPFVGKTPPAFSEGIASRSPGCGSESG